MALPWELLYAADLAVIAETVEELIKRLNEWKENVESKSKGMRLNMNKTKVMIRYDTRCYFNVRSKADISQLNLPHGNGQLKKCKDRKKLKSKKMDMPRSSSKQSGKFI